MNVYTFKWHAIEWKPSDGEMYVQTVDKHMMDLFLIQHGFDPRGANVTIENDPDDYSYDSTTTLRMYTFGSRKRDRIYHVATTDEIIMDIISDVSVELSDAMSLGSCALKGEIQLFSRVEELVEKLDHVCIRETQVDYRDDAYYSYRYPGYPAYPCYEEAMRDDETDALTGDLYDESQPDTIDPIPITLETYISKFTRDYLLGEVVTTHGNRTYPKSEIL